MRAAVDAAEFSQALDKVSKVVKRSAIPVLAGVRVQIANGRCTLTATDLETWLMAEFPACGDDLSFVLQRTRDVSRACRCFAGEVVLEVAEPGADRRGQCWLTLSNGPRAAKVEAISVEDFPEMPGSSAESFPVNAARLLERIGRVKYTLRKPDMETNAAACNVQFSGNTIFALDGYRMAWDIDPNTCVPRPFMVPPEALGYLKLFGDQEVSVQLSERHLRISGGGIVVHTRLTEGRVFDMSAAVPKQYLEEFSVDPQEFLRELLYLREIIPPVGRPYVYFSGGKLTMRMSGETYTTAVQTSGESKTDFAFELRYMIDVMKQFKEECQVRVKVSSPLAPVVIGAEGRSDFAMVLPVRMSAADAA